MTLDVIIPTFNSAATIARVLRALRVQLAPRDRLLVVDDGSTDDTGALIRRLHSVLGLPLFLFAGPHRGPAGSRNAGLAAATGDLVLFLGADCLPSPHLLARHRAVHTAHPEESVACVGFVTWDPHLPPSPFMVWLEHGGNQNAYGEIAGRSWVAPRAYLYGANLSCKRALLHRAGGFDAAHFRGYGWEDLDLGIRLEQMGCRIRYEPTAVAWHVHPQTVATALVRQRTLGRGFAVLRSLHPRVVPPSSRARQHVRVLLERTGVTPTVIRTLGAVARWGERRVILSSVYGPLMRIVFTQSVHLAGEPLGGVDNFPRGPRTIPADQEEDFSALGGRNTPSHHRAAPLVSKGFPQGIHRVVHRR